MAKENDEVGFCHVIYFCYISMRDNSIKNQANNKKTLHACRERPKDRGRQIEKQTEGDRQTDGLKETGRQTDKQTEGDRLSLHVRLAY